MYCYRGTALYASINAHRDKVNLPPSKQKSILLKKKSLLILKYKVKIKISLDFVALQDLSRRDDLWCLWYAIIDLIYEVPWRNIKNDKDLIRRMKEVRYLGNEKRELMKYISFLDTNPLKDCFYFHQPFFA